MSTQPFKFLELPPEIREKIYMLLCTSPNSYILINAPSAHAVFPIDLLLTNVQIYHELRPLYFTSNNFSISILRHNDNWSYFLSPSWLDNRRQIRTLRLNIIRWGSKDFFNKSLVPVLEDCILNGRLRNLEIRTREGWMQMMTGKGNTNWRALRNLLKDPYLEHAVLVRISEIFAPIYCKSDPHFSRPCFIISSNLMRSSGFPSRSKNLRSRESLVSFESFK